MTATATTPLAVAVRRQSTPSLGQVFRAVARAEWTKMRSVRSTMWTLAVTIGLAVGFGALVGVSQVNSWDTLTPVQRLRFDPTSLSLSGLFLAQMAIGVLGVLMITSEYATGQIRATLGATPRRTDGPRRQGGDLRRGGRHRRSGRLLQRLRHRPGHLLREAHRRVSRRPLASCVPSSAGRSTSPRSAPSGSAWARSCAVRPAPSPHWSDCFSSFPWSAPSCQLDGPATSPGTSQRKQACQCSESSRMPRRSLPGPGSQCSSATPRSRSWSAASCSLDETHKCNR